MDDLSRALSETLVGEINCPVCMEFMVSPLKLCTKGHNICSRCTVLSYMQSRVFRDQECGSGKPPQDRISFTFLLCISLNSCNSLLSRCGCHVTEHPRVGQIPELQLALVITRLQMVHYTTQCTDVQRGFLLPNVFRFNGAALM